MLLEFDADQRLWQETVRDAVGKQCPPALVRGIAEDGVDPTPVWKAYVEHGWTEMSDPEIAFHIPRVYGWDGNRYLNEEAPEHTVDPSEYE